MTPPGPNDDETSRETGGTSWLDQYYTPQKPGAGDEFDPSRLLSLEPAEKYGVLENIGAGGMKSVRRALDRNAVRHVAMARLKEGDGQSDSTRRFLREARITAALEHPNIVPVHEIGLDESGAAYFTMKLLGGETLRQILKKRREGDAHYREAFPLFRLLEIFLSVCNAVAFAHARGVIHLDLKPENVQVGSFGEVLVLDWGLARVLPRDGEPAIDLPPELMEVPEQGVVLGTPEFMAPEQAKGDQAALDERTDVYALGALLDVILGGKNPPRPRTPAGLLAVVAKACAVDPAARYAAVEDLAQDIRAFVGGFPTTAQEASVLTQFGLLIKRHKAIAALVGASLVLIVSILSVALVRIHHSERVALDALSEIKAEQERRRQIGLVAAPRVLQQAGEPIRLLEYDQALPILDYALSLDDSLSQAWQQKAALHMGRLEFDQVISALRQEAIHSADGREPKSLRNTLAEVAEKYASMKPDLTGSLPGEQMKNFALDISHAERTPWGARLLALQSFMQRQNSSLQTVNFDVIEALLRRLNPQAKDLVFLHESDGTNLKITLRGSRVSQILPLVGLPMTSLDISGTSVADLSAVHDAPLVELDVSGTDIGEFQCLGRMASLETLRMVDWKRREFDRVRMMPQLKKVIVGARDERDARNDMKSLKQKPELVVE